MKTLKYLALRFASKVVSNAIAFAYDPNQADIIKLIWGVFKVIAN